MEFTWELNGKMENSKKEMVEEHERIAECFKCRDEILWNEETGAVFQWYSKK